MNNEQLAALRAAALAATPQDIDTAEVIDTAQDGSSIIECPACSGDGHVVLEGDYCNYDAAAIGVQFYGIGNEHGAAERYFRAANPATIVQLLDHIDALTARLVELEAEQAVQLSAWSFATNEWADTAHAGLQWLKNIKDGISTADDGIENLRQCMASADEAWGKAKSVTAPARPPAVDVPDGYALVPVVPTPEMLDAIQQVKLIDWNCDVDGNPTSIAERSALSVARAMLAAAPKPAGETCENGQPDCGPVAHHDIEGVPLCARCWQLEEETATQPWPDDASDYGSRIAVVGQNGNDGLHYQDQEGGKDAGA